MALEHKAFTNKFADLVAGLQCSIQAISDECLEKLITEETYQAILHLNKTPGHKARLLLNNVSTTIRKDPTTFNIFLKVLSKFDEHSKVNLEQELVDLKNRAKKDYPQDELHTEFNSIEYSKPHGRYKKPGESTKESQQISPLTLNHTKLPTERKTACKTACKSSSAHKIGRDMKIREKVIKEHLTEIKSCVQRLILPIASKCRTKQLISVKVYHEVTSLSRPKKQRSETLLHYVCKAVRNNSKQFDDFIGILESHYSCKKLTQSIKHGLEEGGISIASKTRSSITQVKTKQTINTPEHKRKDSMPLALDIAEETDYTKATMAVSDNNATSLIVLNSGNTTATKFSTPKVNPDREDEYNKKMDKKQDQVKIAELTKQNENLKKERDEIEKKLCKKNKEINYLEEERDNLQLAKDTLEARLEKQNSETMQRIQCLKKKISDNEKSIGELKGIIKELKDELSDKQSQSIKLLQQQSKEQQQKEQQPNGPPTQDKNNKEPPNEKNTGTKLDCVKWLVALAVIIFLYVAARYYM